MSGPAHRVHSAVEEFGFPQGHLGHLSPDQEAAFENFKALCLEKGYYKPGNGADEEPSHDDALLLRYLRARRFVVSDAWKQFQDTEDWRKANQLDQLYETIDLDHYEETRRLYPQWTGRRDRRGIPVYIFEVKHLNSKTMSAYEKSANHTKTKAETDGKISAKLLRLFALYENLTRFVMPLCTALTDREHPRTPISQSNNIVDISGVGLKQFWNLRTHMQDASTLATAHYPETLDRIFIIGAPAFFPTVWGWIKKWFDPITTSKIFILSHHEMQKTLESFIDPANIPKKYGGQLDFKFGDLPVLDPALEGVLTWNGSRTDFPHGPMYWVHRNNKTEIEAIARGSVNEKERNEAVCVVKRLLNDDEAQDATHTKGHAINTSLEKAPESGGAPVPLPKPESALLTAPTVPSSPATSAVDLTAATTREPLPKNENLVIQAGELLPESRPKLESFVTAQEGALSGLTLAEKSGNLANGHTGPHGSAIANQLDPAVNLDGNRPSESTQIHRE